VLRLGDGAQANFARGAQSSKIPAPRAVYLC
jgi:hypothetical protein